MTTCPQGPTTTAHCGCLFPHETTRGRSVRTRGELENMKANALLKGNADLAHIAEEILQERFPIKTGGHGSTPTTALFRGQRRQFDSGKRAYLWLIQEFRLYRPKILDEYEALNTRAKSVGRLYARTPESLFATGSPHAGNPAFYEKVAEGLYAYTNLNHEAKFKGLVQLGHLANLEFPRDWHFRVDRGTQELADRQRNEAIIRVANRFLAELLQHK